MNISLVLCATLTALHDYCEEILRSRWQKEWGDCDFVIDKIKKCDKILLNISNFSNKTRWEIIKELVRKIYNRFFF